MLNKLAVKKTVANAVSALSLTAEQPMPNKLTFVKNPAVFCLLLLVGLALFTASLVVQKTWQYPFASLFSPSQSLDLTQMVAQLQIIPTMLVAILAGGLLGVVSVLLQQLVKNTLASDTTLAVGTGAELALLLVTLFIPSFGLYGSFSVAFIGSLMSMGLVFAISANSRMNPVVLILSGLVVNILLASLSALLLVFFSETAMGVMVWSSGNLTQSSWQTSQFLLAVSVVLPLVLVLLLKPLTLMSLDDRQAKSLGVPVTAVRLMVVAIVAVVTASVVSRVGMLSFVGLASASMVNVLAIRHVGWRLLAGFGFGAMLLWLTHNLVSLLMVWLAPTPLNLPVGAFTGILGAGLIIWLVLRQSKQHIAHDESANFLTVKAKEKTLSFWLGMVAVLGVVAGVALCVAPNALGASWQLTWQADIGVIEQFRLPRTLSAMATGVMLATAGVLLQSLTRNPMASPEVMGISSGSALGVVLAFVSMPVLLKVFGLETGSNAEMGLLLLAGLVGAGLVLGLILWLARKLSPSYLLLVGVAISALMTGVLTLIKVSGDPRLQAMLSWLSGTTYHANPSSAWWLVSVAVVLFLVSFLTLKPLRVMSLNDSIARSLGVSIKRTEIGILTLVALLSTASTLAVGPLSFIGLMMPHLAMTLGAVRLPQQLALSALLGAGLMMVADWLGRYAMFPYEIPAGAIVSVIGGGYFLWLMKGVKA
ncbi:MULTISPECIES: Fe(3+)-hydroxamate ABC transporter permease FhuB [unclassified Moraxella]|uniref:Fe(3+)-hydroxamate ABC transporter permease FhuB n=1 Tax=unclassified Moraxella TaxID=2685852 RepID=UPI003AF5C511